MDRRRNIKFCDNIDLNDTRQFMRKGNSIVETYKDIPFSVKSTVTHLQNKAKIMNKVLNNTSNIKDTKEKCSNATITNAYQQIQKASTSGYSNYKNNSGTKHGSKDNIPLKKNAQPISAIKFNVTQSQGIDLLQQTEPFNNVTVQCNPISCEEENEGDFCLSETYTSTINDGESIYCDINDEYDGNELLQCNKVLFNAKELRTINVGNNEKDKSSCTRSMQTVEENSNFEIIQNQHTIMKKLDFIMEFITNEAKGEVGSFNNMLTTKANINVINSEYKFQQKSELDKFDLRLQTDQEFLHAFTSALFRFLGKCMKSSIRKMLEFVISYELSVHFSYYGQKNNIKIKDYKFIKIILGLAVETFQCTLGEAETVIKDFFRRAGTKLGKQKMSHTKENRPDASNVHNNTILEEDENAN